MKITILLIIIIAFQIYLTYKIIKIDSLFNKGTEKVWGGDDELYKEAKRIVIEAGEASASLLQYRLKIGYARAARLLDILEEKKVISSNQGIKPREVFSEEKESSNKNAKIKLEKFYDELSKKLFPCGKKQHKEEAQKIIKLSGGKLNVDESLDLLFATSALFSIAKDKSENRMVEYIIKKTNQKLNYEDAKRVLDFITLKFYEREK